MSIQASSTETVNELKAIFERQNFSHAKNMKLAIENDWNNHREKGGRWYYYLTIKE